MQRTTHTVMHPTARPGTHPTARPVRRLVPVAAALSLVVLASCTSNDDGGEGATKIDVSSGDDDCTLSATTAPAGNVTFSVKNTGGQVTEFYLYAEGGSKIVGEVENIGPGITRDMVVGVDPGSYVTACKPGMTGEGIRADFTVTAAATGSSDGAAAAEDDAALAAATAQYEEYVREQVGALVTSTQQFADAVVAGDDDAARALYPQARTYWERIEPVAESFGDLDPRLDLREADLEPGQEWTGWHRLEKHLWPPAAGDGVLDESGRSAVAAQLVADTEELATRVETLDLHPTQLGNGAKELLDEVATGKVTGEEEIWSGTDLWDFQANVDGARTAYEALRPVLVRKDAALAALLDERFAAVQEALEVHRDGDGFVAYSALTPEQVSTLAAAVDALGEPLSRLTAQVVL